LTYNIYMTDTLKLKDKPLPKAEQTPTDTNISKVEIEKEYGGPKGKDPTRYGDWEMKGRCIDF
jgi:hypothetical protein